MNNSFQVKKEANNDPLEAINFSMQRMELNVLKVVGNLTDRVNAMENKLDSLLMNINNLERNTANTLAGTVNGLASHLEKAHATNNEKHVLHIAEVQTLTQVIAALRQNPNAYNQQPVGGVPLPVMQQQQPIHPSTFRPVHPNLQAAPSIPPNAPLPSTQMAQHVQPPSVPHHVPLAPPQITQHVQPPTPQSLPLQPPQQHASPATSSIAKTEAPAQSTETKSLFGGTAKPATFAFSPSTQNSTASTTPFGVTKPAETTSPFGKAPAKETSSPFVGKPTEQQSLFGGPSANKAPLSFSSITGGTSFLNKTSAETANNSFGAQQSSTFVKKDNDEEGGNENPEEYVPDAHYEPVVPLPDKIDVKTGEEGEDVLFKNRCKLYIFNVETKEVKERGVGDIKILYDPTKKSHRVVMRREQVHKICANFRISNGMSVTDKAATKNCGVLSCIDYSENNEAGVKCVFYVRFREETVYEEFKKLFNDIAEGKQVLSTNSKEAPTPEVKKDVDEAITEPKKEATPIGFGDKFAIKEDEWDCAACYTRNKQKDGACLACGTGKDGKERVSNEPAFKPTTFSSNKSSTFSFGTPSDTQKPLFGFQPASPATTSVAKNEAPAHSTETKSLFGGTAKPVTFSFAPSSQNSTASTTPFSVTKPAETTSPFGKAPAKETSSPFASASSPFAVKTTEQKSLFGGSSSPSTNKAPLSFSSITGGTSFLNKAPAETANHSFGAQQSSTFAKKDNDEEGGNENPEEYVPDVHYEPVVPLPDKIDVKTGEEGEDVLFKNRCKLYVFNAETKEVKERGVGDIKILYDPTKKSHRVVMRREQVHKICANFRISNGMNIVDKTGTKGSGTFTCIDFSENSATGIQSTFIVRFREENVYEEFKKIINDIGAGKVSIKTESKSSVITTNKAHSYSTVPTLPNIGFSNNPSVEEEQDDDFEGEDYGEEGYGEEGYDEEDELIYEADCKLILGEAYKSPLSKGKASDEVYNDIKLLLSVADEGIYKVEFDNGKEETIFPHYIQNDTKYKLNGKNITFVARDHNASRKSVTCEFKDNETAQKTYDTLLECCQSTTFDGYED